MFFLTLIKQNFISILPRVKQFLLFCHRYFTFPTLFLLFISLGRLVANFSFSYLDYSLPFSQYLIIFYSLFFFLVVILFPSWTKSLNGRYYKWPILRFWLEKLFFIDDEYIRFSLFFGPVRALLCYWLLIAVFVFGLTTLLFAFKLPFVPMVQLLFFFYYVSSRLKQDLLSNELLPVGFSSIEESKHLKQPYPYLNRDDFLVCIYGTKRMKSSTQYPQRLCLAIPKHLINSSKSFSTVSNLGKNTIYILQSAYESSTFHTVASFREVGSFLLGGASSFLAAGACQQHEKQTAWLKEVNEAIFTVSNQNMPEFLDNADPALRLAYKKAREEALLLFRKAKLDFENRPLLQLFSNPETTMGHIHPIVRGLRNYEDELKNFKTTCDELDKFSFLKIPQYVGLVKPESYPLLPSNSVLGETVHNLSILPNLGPFQLTHPDRQQLIQLNREYFDATTSRQMRRMLDDVKKNLENAPVKVNVFVDEIVYQHLQMTEVSGDISDSVLITRVSYCKEIYAADLKKYILKETDNGLVIDYAKMIRNGWTPERAWANAQEVAFSDIRPSLLLQDSSSISVSITDLLTLGSV